MPRASGLFNTQVSVTLNPFENITASGIIKFWLKEFESNSKQ
jgi:hypothetical protein